MAKPEKDQVLDASTPETNSGAGSCTPSSEPGATSNPAVDSHKSAAGDTSKTDGDVLQQGAEENGEVLAGQDEASSAQDSQQDGQQAQAQEQESEAELLEKARAEAADWQDKYLRLHAEWDTYRRRTTEQRAAEKERAAEKLVTGLLPVLDDFERTIDYATKNGETGLLSGVQAVHTKLIDVLVKDGVQVIDPQGQAFDALEAQAVATVDDASVPDETVAEVYQKGYRLGSKVLRPAMVTVTTGGAKRETEEA